MLGDEPPIPLLGEGALDTGGCRRAIIAGVGIPEGPDVHGAQDQGGLTEKVSVPSVR
jgi:hypothetical protein